MTITTAGSPKFLNAGSPDEFIRLGTDLMAEEIRSAVDKRKFCILGLSGGSTPKPIYEALGKENIDWSNVWIFLVDDRYIRADDPSSNQFLLRSTLLKNAPIPESQIIFPDTTLSLEKCIDLYDRQITDLMKKGSPDLITLGLGDDGHIASLFPLLSDDAFGPASVIHTTTEKFAVKDRISVTIPVLKKARQAVFFLKGIEKKKVWEDMEKSRESEKRWPAKSVMSGTPVVLVAQW